MFEVQNLSVVRTTLPLKAIGENFSFPLSGSQWFSSTLGDPWLVAISLQSLCPSLHSLSPSVTVSLWLLISLSVSHQGHQSLDLGLTLILYNVIINWLHLKRPYFHIRLQLLGVRTSIHLPGVTNPTHNSGMLKLFKIITITIIIIIIIIIIGYQKVWEH